MKHTIVYAPCLHVGGVKTHIGYYETKATAERLSQVKDVKPVSALEVDGQIYIPVDMIPATKMDKKKHDAYLKAIAAGLSDEEINRIK